MPNAPPVSVDPADPEADDFSAADAIGAMFRDPTARAENDPVVRIERLWGAPVPGD